VHNTHNASALTPFTFSSNVKNPHTFTFNVASNTLCVITMEMSRDDEADTLFWIIKDQSLLAIP
jgi:hypothetical protein